MNKYNLNKKEMTPVKVSRMIFCYCHSMCIYCRNVCLLCRFSQKSDISGDFKNF